MSHVISICNQKGGVGKSTTAYALSSWLHLKGHRVLLVDLDPQGNISATTKTPENKGNAYDLLTRKATPQEVIKNTERGDIIPSGRSLSTLDIELSGLGRENRLKEVLAPLKKFYSFIIIDTPPALGLLTINALTASDSVLIPAQADYYSLQGIGQLYETIEAIRHYTNPNLELRGILLTRHNTRTILSRDMAELIEATATQLNTFVYNTFIRECISIKEAQAVQMDIFSYAPRSNAAEDYENFVIEFMEGGAARERSQEEL